MRTQVEPKKKIDNFDQVRSQQDAIDYALGKDKAKGRKVLPGYTEVSTSLGAVTLRNSDRPIQKQERTWIAYLFKTLGLLVFSGIAFAILWSLIV